MSNFKSILMTGLICGALALPSVALAKKGGNGNGHGNGKGHHKEHDDDDNGHHKHHSDRDILRGYVIKHYKAHCPPGLAKKNPPCIPPGQAKKFARGAFLPEIGFEPLPQDIVVLLSPPPPDAYYVRMDRNVYLITEGTRKVVEAFELFSEVR